MLVGSKEVVESYFLWKSVLVDGAYDNPDTYEAMIDCINIMREDLGLEKSNIGYEIFDRYAYVSKETYKKWQEEKQQS